MALLAATEGEQAHATALQPQEIAPGVYCLGVGQGVMRSNVYFVRSGASWVLIDAGPAGCEGVIQEAARSLFGAGAAAAIVLTHDHPDHAGSAKALARAWSCLVYVHPDELPLVVMEPSTYIATVTAYANPLDRWLILPMLRLMPQRRRESMLLASSCKEAACTYDPGASVPHLPDWACIATPGHTPGHVSLFRAGDRVLLTGDAVLTLHLDSLRNLALSGLGRGKPGLSGPPQMTTWRWGAARASVAALAELEPRLVASGHGSPMSGGGIAAELRALAAAL